jgi:beta-glucosidase
MNHRTIRLIAGVLVMLTGVTACLNESGPRKKEVAYTYAFQNPEMSIDDRARDLVSRLTLDEKVQQMMYTAPAIERLGIPAYNWWNECLHGVARAGKATVFPQAIGMAASFDDELLFKVSSAIADEGRAFYNEAVKQGNRLQYGGLTFWTPNVNIFRDPRWGRGQETYGEDPFLTGTLGTAFVKGLQGDDPRYLKAAGCAKHFAVHSGPEKLRHEFNAVASPKDLNETYLPAFEMLTKAGVEGFMCAYNRTNDEACCGSNLLLQDYLRGKWKFDGYITSDCWALVDFHAGHKITKTAVESAALALRRGVNLNCGSVYYPGLVDAVKQGLITEAEVDSSLVQLLKTRFRLGLFDPDDMVPFSKIGSEVIDSREHRRLAREMAQKSIVLLKNNNVLPLKKNTKSVYVVGPNANNVEVLLGNYYGLNGNMSTIVEGITSKVEPGCFVTYKQGAQLYAENQNPIDWTTPDAKTMDVTIAVMGISGNLEGEEGESIASPTAGDRLDIGLPANQLAFLRKLKEGNTKPLIVVVTGGSPIAMPEVQELADAVLFVWYPGEEGGNAVADVLFGDVAPSGHLPVTFPISVDQLPPYDDYRMDGRTYRYMTKEPLYPFGFGLSYTHFEFSDLTLGTSSVKTGEALRAEVKVTNAGNFEGDAVVQLYLSAKDAPFKTPLASLKGFDRISLKPGESKRVSFDLTPELLSLVNEDGVLAQVPGSYKLIIGESSPSPRSEALGAAKPAEAEFIITR